MNKTIIIKKTQGGGTSEGFEYIESTPSPHGFSVGNLIYRTATGWALCDNTSAATAQMHAIVDQVIDASNFRAKGTGAVVTVPGAGWTPNTIGYVGAAGAITFVQPVAQTPGTLWRAQAVRTLTATTAMVMDGVAEPAEKLQLSEFAQLDGPVFILRESGGPGPIEVVPPYRAGLLIVSGNPSAPVSGLTALVGYDPVGGRLVYALAPAGGGSSTDYSRVEISGDNVDLSLGPRFNKVIAAGGTWNITFSNRGVARETKKIFVKCLGSATINWSGAPTASVADGFALTSAKEQVFEIDPTTSGEYVYKPNDLFTVDVAKPTVTGGSVNSTGDVVTINLSEGIKNPNSILTGFSIPLSTSVALTVASISGSTLTCTPARVIEQGDGTPLPIAYTKPGGDNGIMDLANNTLDSFASGVVTLTNGSTVNSLIENVGFNTLATLPSPRWSSTGSGVVFGSNAITIEGAGVLLVPANFAGSAILAFLQAYPELHFRFFVNLGTLSSSGGINFRNASSAIVANISFRSGASGLRMSHGSATAIPSKTLALSTGYTIFGYYKRATSGNNGEVQIIIADGYVTTRPALTAANSSTITTGSSADAISSMLIATAGGAGPNYFDKFLFSTSPIPDGYTG